VRDLIRKALVEQEWSDPNAEVVAALSIVFDHKQAVTKGLTDMQHEDHHAILCSQHVHITHERCLEVILMRGKAAQLRRIADAIITTRGVKTGQLTMLSENV
jgi:CopG family nickel-responsive transcriptional regulator